MPEREQEARALGSEMYESSECAVSSFVRMLFNPEHTKSYELDFFEELFSKMMDAPDTQICKELRDKCRNFVEKGENSNEGM